MIAQRLQTVPPGLYKVASGQYLLFKISSTLVRRINHRDPDAQDAKYHKGKERFSDIEPYNHVFVTEIPLIALIKKNRAHSRSLKEKRNDSQAAQARQGVLHPYFRIAGSYRAPSRQST